MLVLRSKVRLKQDHDMQTKLIHFIFFFSIFIFASHASLVFCLGTQILNFHSRAFLKLFLKNKIKNKSLFPDHMHIHIRLTVGDNNILPNFEIFRFWFSAICILKRGGESRKKRFPFQLKQFTIHAHLQSIGIT